MGQGTEMFQALFLLVVDREHQSVVLPTVQPQFSLSTLR